MGDGLCLLARRAVVVQLVRQSVYWNLAPGAKGLFQLEVSLQLHILHTLECRFTISNTWTFCDFGLFLSYRSALAVASGPDSLSVLDSLLSKALFGD